MVKRKPRALTRDTRQTGTSNSAIDKKRKALGPGKRRSKNGTIYYENRKNRSDVKGRDTPTRAKAKLRLTSKLSVPLTVERKKRILTQYNKNEARNYHTENAIMLIRLFGTDAQRKRAKVLKARIDKRKTGVLKSEWDWFYKHGHSHYKKLLPKKRTVKKVVRKSKGSTIVGKSHGRRVVIAVSKHKTLTPKKEDSNKRVAMEILRQLGGRTFMRMTGANQFLSGSNWMAFKLPRAIDGNRRIKITLNSMDTYDIKFMSLSGKTNKIVKGIYEDQLKDIISRYTGLALTMPRFR